MQGYYQRWKLLKTGCSEESSASHYRENNRGPSRKVGICTCLVSRFAGVFNQVTVLITRSQRKRRKLTMVMMVALVGEQPLPNFSPCITFTPKRSCSFAQKRLVTTIDTCNTSCKNTRRYMG